MEQITDVRDSALRERVLRQLAFTRDFNGKDVCVRAEHGRVTLTGSVASYPEKIAAAETAKRLFGVRSITNDLTVRHAPSISDADLQNALNGALVSRGASPTVTAHAIDGRVVLEGTVDWRLVFPDGGVGIAQSRVTDTTRGTCIYSFVLNAPPVALERLEGALEAQITTLRSELATLKSLMEA